MINERHDMKKLQAKYREIFGDSEDIGQIQGNEQAQETPKGILSMEEKTIIGHLEGIKILADQMIGDVNAGRRASMDCMEKIQAALATVKSEITDENHGKVEM